MLSFLTLLCKVFIFHSIIILTAGGGDNGIINIGGYGDIMRINVQRIETKNTYRKEEKYYASDNQLEMLKFLIDSVILKEQYRELTKLDLKERKKVQEVEKAISDATKLIDTVTRTLNEFNKIKTSINDYGIEYSYMKSVENKIISDMSNKLSNAMKMIKKCKKYYENNLIATSLPTYDKKDEKIESSRYVFKSLGYKEQYMKTPLSLNLNRISIFDDTSTKDIIKQSSKTYEYCYQERFNKRKIEERKMNKDKKIHYPYEVPEIDKLKKLIEQTENDKDKRKLTIVLGLYEELKKNKIHLYITEKQKNILFNNTSFTGKYFKEFIQKLENEEENTKTQIRKCEEKIEAFKTNKKDVNEIVQNVEHKIDLTQKLNDIQSRLIEKEESVARVRKIVEDLRREKESSKASYDSKAFEAYQTKYIPERKHTDQNYRSDGDVTSWEYTEPAHEEYIHDEETRNFIMGTSKEDLEKVTKELEEQEGLLRTLENELNDLKRLEQESKLNLEKFRQEYKKQSFLEKLKERIKVKNKNQNDSMKM